MTRSHVEADRVFIYRHGIKRSMHFMLLIYSELVNECQFKLQYAKLRVMGYQNLFFFSVISQYFFLF